MTLRYRDLQWNKIIIIVNNCHNVARAAADGQTNWRNRKKNCPPRTGDQRPTPLRPWCLGPALRWRCAQVCPLRSAGRRLRRTRSPAAASVFLARAPEVHYIITHQRFHYFPPLLQPSFRCIECTFCTCIYYYCCTHTPIRRAITMHSATADVISPNDYYYYSYYCGRDVRTRRNKCICNYQVYLNICPRFFSPYSC